MPNLFLNVHVEVMDYTNNNWSSSISKIKSYENSIYDLNDNNLEELRTLIMDIKGDWINFKKSFFNETYYVDVCLIFHGSNLSTYDEKIIGDVIIECDKFLFSYRALAIDNSINNAEKISEILDEEGFILKISENDGGGILSCEEIENELNRNGIKYIALNKTKATFDGGASGATEHILFFVMSSIASGITWDVIKPILTGGLQIPSQCITTKVLDKYNFNKLRKVIADRIRVNEKNLILIDMNKRGSTLKFEFRTQNKKIYITCDSNYNIKNLKVNEDVA